MPNTVPMLFLAAVDRNREAIAFHWVERGAWRSMTWAESARQVARVARGLEALGVGHGARVAVLSDTRREWACVDMATLSLGGITVGIYPSLTAEQVAWQLAHAEARIVVVENAAQAAKVAAARERLPALEHVVAIEPAPGLPSLEEVAKDADLDWLRQRATRVRPEDTATLIYTSGTTGHPKGAMLTHRNFVHVCEATETAAALERGDRGVIFLPLAHSLQRYAMYFALTKDIEGFYAESLEKLPEALRRARPQVLASVPRMLEKIRAKAQAAVAERGPRAVAVFDWAFAVGRRAALLREQGARLPRRLRLQLLLADRLVFRRVRERFGGELRVLACGGAALDPELARWFQAMGVSVLEGWGLTETAAPATINREHDYRIGSVGKPIPGLELRIAEDGEILVRGPGVFAGYYKDEAATAEAFEGDWFKTGDVGRLDEDGFLYITDRKKEILVTAGGKNIAPVNIESRVMRSPYVAQAVAVGDDRPYVAALLVPDAEALDALSRVRGWPDEPLAARLRRPEVQSLLADAVTAANADLAPFEQVKRWTAIPAELSVASGELTPTLKLKRRVVAEQWREEIAGLYR